MILKKSILFGAALLLSITTLSAYAVKYSLTVNNNTSTDSTVKSSLCSGTLNKITHAHETKTYSGIDINVLCSSFPCDALVYNNSTCGGDPIAKARYYVNPDQSSYVEISAIYDTRYSANVSQIIVNPKYPPQAYVEFIGP